MHPLALIGTLAAGAVVLAKATGKSATPTAAPDPAAVRAAAGLARSRMAQGATPEQAAAWASEKIASRGGGFWDDQKPRGMQF